MSSEREFPEQYAIPPTPEQQRALHRRRAAAEQSPLERGDTLEWRGPALYDDVLHVRLAKLSGRAIGEELEVSRPAHDELLSSSGPARSDKLSYSLELVEPLQTGVAWSQVWRCRAREAGSNSDAHRSTYDVVVKFLDEALFPYPEGELVSESVDDWDWWAADTLEDREGDAYAALRSLQGVDLPICYGFYHFRLPRGETITGVVLEDLTISARPIREHVKRAKGLYSRDFAAADGIIRSLFAGIRKMHDLETSEFDFQPSDIFVLKSSPATAPKLVFLDFGKARSKAFTEATIKISWEQTRIKEGGLPGARALAHWRHQDEHWAAHMGREQTSSEMWTRWEAEENKRETMGLWYQSTSRD